MKKGPAAPEEEASWERAFTPLWGWWERVILFCVPPPLRLDTELYRRGRLITGFGVLGALFGAAYAAFYLAIGHRWGAIIVILCSICVAGVPPLLRRTGNIKLAGNLLTLILLMGFSALCAIEGGVRGHAIGWLAAIPLCALLLVDGSTSLYWCVVCTCVTGTFVVLDARGVILPFLYPASWHGAVTAAGYLGLTIFMCVLGIIFEGGRRTAFGRMERALVRLSEANGQLKKMDAEKNVFLGIAAHDLKNPLNVVMGFAELIAKGPERNQSRNREDAQYILQAAERMISLITQLLDVNAIEQGAYPVTLQPYDLNVLSAEVISTYASAALQKHIRIHVAPAEGPVDVMLDVKAGFQILDNLFSNAIKYSPPGSEVFVRTTSTPRGGLWEVRDQGAGLSEEDQAKLFQKFTKLSTRPTGGESSTGLGLSIVKMLSEAMGGTVECRSQLGVGTTFTLRLPVACPLGASPGEGALP